MVRHDHARDGTVGGVEGAKELDFGMRACAVASYDAERRNGTVIGSGLVEGDLCDRSLCGNVARVDMSRGQTITISRGTERGGHGVQRRLSLLHAEGM